MASNWAMLPPAFSASAYAASLADTIIIEAIVSSNGHFCPAFMPIVVDSRPAAFGAHRDHRVGGQPLDGHERGEDLGGAGRRQGLVQVATGEDGSGPGVDDDERLRRGCAFRARRLTERDDEAAHDQRGHEKRASERSRLAPHSATG